MNLPLTDREAVRIRHALEAAAEARLTHVALLSGNPLGIEFRRWQNLEASLVHGDLSYYRHFSAIRGFVHGRESQLLEALDWFHKNNAPTKLGVCSFDSTERELQFLLDQGLRHSQSMTALFAPCDHDFAALSKDDIRVIESDEAFWPLRLEGNSEEEQAILRPIAEAEFADWRRYVAFLDGQPAGMACLYLHDGVGVMASAWTRPEVRNRGVQTALLLARITDSASAGCGLVVSEAVTGSGSQRNMERIGMRPAYTEEVWTNSAT